MSWRDNANGLLLRHVLSGRDRGIDYAPDNGGPHTVVIGRMLYRQAMAWADDMAEAQADCVRVDGRKAWDEALALVDDRIRKYIAANKLERAA